MIANQFPIQYTQNFLKSERLVEKIVSFSAIQEGSTVLEVGPGKGIITQELARKVGRNGKIIAIELDEQLAADLQHLCQSFPQIKIIQKDILQIDLRTLSHPYYVFSNIPFNITALLLTHLFDPTSGPEQAHLILQYDALVATTQWGKGETLKSLLIKPFYKIAAVHNFSRADFTPQPNVNTTLFSFTRHSQPTVSPQDYDHYQDFLAYISKDRVGEGAWLNLFSKKQIKMMAKTTSLVIGRGLKSQSVEAITAGFNTFQIHCRPRHTVVAKAMQTLRQEQQRKTMIDRQGNHRRKQR